MLGQRSEASSKTHIIKFEESTIDVLEICAKHYINGTSEINGTGHIDWTETLPTMAGAEI